MGAPTVANFEDLQPIEATPQVSEFEDLQPIAQKPVLPGIPKPPLPPGLAQEFPSRTPTGQIQSTRPGIRALLPLTDQQFAETVKAQGPPADTGLGPVIGGAVRSVAGAHSLATGKDISGEPYSRVKGAAEAIGGAMEAATPGMAEGIVAAPLESAIVLGLGGLSDVATQKALKQLNVPEEWQELGGTIAGLVGGTAAVFGTKIAGEALFRSMLRKVLQDKVNADYKARADAERTARQETAKPKRIGGEVPEPPTAPPEDIREAEFEDLKPVSEARTAPGTPAQAPVPAEFEDLKPVATENPSYELPTGTVQVTKEEGPHTYFTKTLPDGTEIPEKRILTTAFNRMVEGAAPAQEKSVNGQTVAPAEQSPASSEAKEVIQPNPTEAKPEGAGEVGRSSSEIAEEIQNIKKTPGEAPLEMLSRGNGLLEEYRKALSTEVKTSNDDQEIASKYSKLLTAMMRAVNENFGHKNIEDGVKKTAPESGDQVTVYQEDGKPLATVSKAELEQLQAKQNPPAPAPDEPVADKSTLPESYVQKQNAKMREDAGASKISGILGSAKRNYTIGGEKMEDPDPRAQIILRSLSPEDQKRVDEMMWDAKEPKVLSSGFDHVVLDLGNGKVMRLGQLPAHEAKNDLIAKPIESKTVGKVGVEIYPKLDASGITDADVKKVTEELAAKGFEWQDAAPDNLARDAKGNLQIIDGRVVKSNAPKPRSSQPVRVGSSGGEVLPLPKGVDERVPGPAGTPQSGVPGVQQADGDKAVEQKGAEEAPRKYSSTQVNLPEEFASKAREAAAKIPDDVLAEDGRENEPHVTVLYGTHTTTPEPVQELLKGIGPVTGRVKTVSVFPANKGQESRGGAQYDVVKLDVDSPQLTELNKKLGALPNSNTFPTYKPHITLAYVKPGEGKKFVGRVIPGLSGKEITFDTATVSPSEGEVTHIPLKPKEKGATPDRRRIIMRGAHDRVTVEFPDKWDAPAFDAAAKSSLTRASGQNPRGQTFESLIMESNRLAGKEGIDENKARGIILDYHAYVKDLAKEQTAHSDEELKITPQSLAEFTKENLGTKPVEKSVNGFYTSPKDAFKMKGPELAKLAKAGDKGAQAEIDRRAEKNGTKAPKVETKPATAETVAPKGETKTPAVKASDRSVKQLPVMATIKDGTITVVTKAAGKPFYTVSFPDYEWPAEANARAFGNIHYQQDQFIKQKMKDAGVSFDENIDVPGQEQMINPDRLADAHRHAINEALEKTSKPTYLHTFPGEANTQAVVYKMNSGKYAAALEDLDENKIVNGSINIVDSEAKAVAKAKELVNGPEKKAKDLKDQFAGAVQTDHLSDEDIDKVADIFKKAEEKPADKVRALEEETAEAKKTRDLQTKALDAQNSSLANSIDELHAQIQNAPENTGSRRAIAEELEKKLIPAREMLAKLTEARKDSRESLAEQIKFAEGMLAKEPEVKPVSPFFRPGERVEVNLHSGKSGNFGTVENISTSGQFYVVKMDDGTEREAHRKDVSRTTQPTPEEEPHNYQKGQEVTWDGPSGPISGRIMLTPGKKDLTVRVIEKDKEGNELSRKNEVIPITTPGLRNYVATEEPEHESFKYEIEVDGEPGKWYPNQVAFATKAEAEAAGRDKFSSWMMAKNYRVVPSTEKPNYVWSNGGMKRIEEGEATTPEPTVEVQRSPAGRLADAVYQKLSAGESLGDVRKLTEMAEKAFGSSRSSGEWTPKDMFDAMEAGINKHLIDRGKDLLSMPFEKAMQELRDLMGRVTSQGVRTDEQIAAQQFSTPPTESFLTASVAALKPTDIVLEPSAGNGGLAVWPKSIGAQTYVNEIADRRRQMLEDVGFGVPTAHDGEIINSLLDPAIKPTVILMNPPFSAGVVKSGPAANKNQYGFNHVDSALQRLAPGGRLVAILGGGRADDMNGGATLLTGPSGKWFSDLAKRYNVRANIRIHGREYQKYGTSFATRVIVIDKDGPTPSRMKEKPDWESVVRGIADTIEQAYTLLRGIANDRPTVRTANEGGAGKIEPRATESATGGLFGASSGPILPGSTGTSGKRPLGGRPGLGRSIEGSSGNVSERSGEPTGLRESGNQPGISPEGSPVGAPESGIAHVNAERPVSDSASDLAASSGISPQSIIDAAIKALAEKTGRKPNALEPQPKMVRAPRKATAARPPAPKQPEAAPKTAISSAADAARQRLREKLAQRAGDGKEPTRLSIDFTRRPAAIDPQDLIDLSTIGAEHMLSGATEFPEWVSLLKADVGDLVEMVAKQAGQTIDDVNRQIYQYAASVAKQFGVEVSPAPPAVPNEEAKKETSGNGPDSVPLTLERNTVARPEVEDTDAYVEYLPTIKGPEHPGAIVETKTMATVPLPEITYRPHLPKSVLDSGRLSAVQLEAVALAGQQNEIILPGGQRASALIGDGTGVGKGRTSAAILYDNFRQGRKRLVWVSEKWPLMQDAIRDLSGIGATELTRGNEKKANGQFAVTSTSAVRPFGAYKAGEKIKHEGVLFSTYALIRSESKKGERRAAQLEEYLRGDDDGEGAYILFDESHNLKNAVVGQGGQASQIGVAVKQLLANIPKLRTVSLSATAATDVMNLGYLDRLGLWGAGTAFPTGFAEFAGQIASGRLAAMEMIARELKAQGKYLSRTLSFKGVTYEEHEHEVNADQKALYRTAARAWKSVVTQAEASIKDTTRGGGRQVARFMAQFGAAQQRFFGLLITALKVPTAVELANKALAEGKSVVITLVNTNEAAQNREKTKAVDLDDEDEIPDYDFGPKQMLYDLVKEHFPVQQYRDDVDDNGNPVKVPVYTVDEEGRQIPVNNPEAEETRRLLLKEIDDNLHMPENPLDVLVNSLGGPSKVAELTGRKERFDSSVGKFVPRGDPNAARKDVNNFEARHFQTGKKRISVLSGAAGTGISLHAGLDVPNQQTRYHITLQVGWSADKQMQMFGRTHRTNQKQPPQYVMLVSDLGGEKRFVSTIARRLGSLGAITKGQKNASSGTDLMEKVNFETEQGKQATRAFYEQLLKNNPVPGTGLTGMQVLSDLRMLEGEPPTVPLRHRDNVTRLLNRLLALDPDVQNGAYNYFFDIFQAAVQRAIDNGTLDTGVKVLPGDEFKIVEQRVIATNPSTGAETFYYPVEAKVRLKRVSVKDLEDRMKSHRGDNPQIRRNEDGKLILSIKADPIVHASGSLEEASYTVNPGNGVWVKRSNRSIYKFKEVEEWANEEVESAREEVNSTERSLKYADQDVARQVDYAKSKALRPLKEQRERAQNQLGWTKDPTRVEELNQQVEELDQKIAEAEKYKLPEDDWQVRNRAAAQKTYDEAVEKLTETQKIAEDPIAWAKEQWGEVYGSAPSHETVNHHLIGGAVMKYWNPVREASAFSNIYTATDSKTGKRVVGVDIPEEGIRQLVDRISGGQSTVDASQLYIDVVRNNLTYTLEGGTQIRRGRVGKDSVLQLLPGTREIGDNLKQMGVVVERGVSPIFYIPTDFQKANQILERVLNEYPVEADHNTPEPPEPAGPSYQSEKSVNGQEPTRESRGLELEGTGPIRTAYRNGILWVNSAGMKKLAEVFGSDAANGMYIPSGRASGLISKVPPELRPGITAALKAGPSITVVRMNPGESISQSKAKARHELFHATETWGREGRATDLLEHPLAQRASALLAGGGYEAANQALMFSEIGAHLASGPVGWEAMGLDENEAEELFIRYLELLDDQTVAKLNRVTPLLKRELNAERSIRREQAELGQSGSGEDGEVEGSPEQGEEGIPTGVSENVQPGQGTRPTGTGKVKESKLAKGVEEKAIRNGLTDGFAGRPEYQTVNIAEQAQLAARLIESDPAHAIEIAMGREMPPAGLLPESVFVAVENYATANKDVNLLRDLATASTLSMEATGMGQRIRMLGERNPDSPVSAMQQVVDAREKAAKKRYGPKAKEKIKAEIKATIKKAAPKKSDWAALIEAIKCP